MIEQPSVEAITVAKAHSRDEWGDDHGGWYTLAQAIEALIAQRVSAETERWQNRDRQRLDQIDRLQETVQSFQSARAERPVIRPADPDVLRASLNAIGPSHDGAVERDLVASTGEQPAERPAPEASFAADLAAAQEPLGAEFEKVLHNNLDQLYVRSEPAAAVVDYTTVALLARLQEPDVRQAIISEAHRRGLPSAHPWILSSIDAAIAKIAEMLK